MANPHHEELRIELEKRAGEMSGEPWQRLSAYLGTDKRCHGVKSEVKGRIVRDFASRHADLALPDYVALLGSLCRGPSHDEVSLAGALLQRLPRLRRQLEPRLLDGWLDAVEGWAETDALCQSSFTARELLARWEDWQALLTRLSQDGNVHKRRASLVLLTRPVRESADARLAEMAFANLDRLKGERHILITKAISWLLRDLIRNHRERVAAYLGASEPSLPRIAVREARRKLLTGRK